MVAVGLDPPRPVALGPGACLGGRARARRPELSEAVAQVLVALRRAKTEAKGSMRAQVARCVVTGPPSLVELVELASGDLRDAGAIARLDLVADPRATRPCRSASSSPRERRARAASVDEAENRAQAPQ